jgi:hypothetical protein
VVSLMRVTVSVAAVLTVMGCTADSTSNRRRSGAPPPGRPTTTDASSTTRTDARPPGGDAGSASTDGAIAGDAGTRPRDSGPPPVDAGPKSPCPDLDRGDTGRWEFLERHSLCVYSSISGKRTFSSAERRCQSLGGSMPRASELDPLCDDILFRRGVIGRGRQVQSSVWVRDTFQDGHLLWADKGYNASADQCTRSDTRCGTLQHNQQCQEVYGYSTDNLERGYACLKRVRR